MRDKKGVLYTSPQYQINDDISSESKHTCNTKPLRMIIQQANIILSGITNKIHLNNILNFWLSIYNPNTCTQNILYYVHINVYAKSNKRDKIILFIKFIKSSWKLINWIMYLI